MCGYPRCPHQGLFRTEGQSDRGDGRSGRDPGPARRGRLRTGLVHPVAAARGILRPSHTERLEEAQAAASWRAERGERRSGHRSVCPADQGARRERRLHHEERSPRRNTQPIAEHHFENRGRLIAIIVVVAAAAAAATVVAIAATAAVRAPQIAPSQQPQQEQEQQQQQQQHRRRR